MDRQARLSKAAERLHGLWERRNTAVGARCTCGFLNPRSLAVDGYEYGVECQAMAIGVLSGDQASSLKHEQIVT